jgi:hypothetical protein
MLRNVAIAARNLGDTSAAAPLAEILGMETDPALRKEIERTLAALASDRSGGRPEDDPRPGQPGGPG